MKDLICQKIHNPATSPLYNYPFSRKWCSTVERALDWEALNPGFIFSFASILVPLDFCFLIYNNNGNKMLPLIE